MNKKYNEIIEQLTDKEITFHLYITQIILFIISCGLGYLLFGGFSFLRQHFQLYDVHIFIIGIPLGCVVVLVDLLLMNVLPPKFYDDGGLNVKIFSQKPIWQILWIAFLVAVSEELLFRGIIQTKTSLIIASIIFAIIHYRYLFNWFLFLNIILLSFLIGIIYEWTDNLAVTIMMHFIIDFLLGLYIRFKNRRINVDDEQGGTTS